MLDSYVDALEIARNLKVHPETVRRLIREGKLPAIKFGNKWIIEKDQLSAFAQGYIGCRGRPDKDDGESAAT